MEGQLPQMFNALDILSYTRYTRGPTIVGTRRKLLNIGSPDAWKMLFSDHLLYVEYKK